MSIKYRYILLFVMGLFAILLVLSFSTFQLTTYQSLRDISSNIAEIPSQKAYLDGQYKDMRTFFSENKGEFYTYYFESLPVSISKSQVTGLTEQETIDLVLDSFTAKLYHVKYGGITAKISEYAGSGSNGLYLVITIILFIAFVSSTIFTLHPGWKKNSTELLRSTGKTLAVMCLVSMIVFVLAPGIVKTMIWQYIPSTGNARDILEIVESRVTATLFFNNLIMVILGALIYASGAYLEKRKEKTPVGTVETSRPAESKLRRSL
ncbi:hypothetical protein CUJ83_13675 [Methanocella sp. CWC-04]|uniref:Uncharacterized protein n=1 Tax=Methanooceanicella nereidis TaxID=2052831 RepID=A0AAP2REV5_9EURY|nr:hypothetical protein [Methanocella sp. CWC-04]MCD1296048.1 hypothetical protein [Methanocella sp. CWC-04]